MLLRDDMYYIGLDVHKKTISYCVKDVAGHVHREGKIGSTRRELDAWIKTLPEPRTIAMEATIFTGWIYDHLLPHAEQVKVAHPLMLRAIAAAKKKNDRIDAGKIADCLRCDFLPGCHMASTSHLCGWSTATDPASDNSGHPTASFARSCAYLCARSVPRE
jgi:transposase